ncbi:MAG: MBL fold metallo-hydrolase [Hyphomicrobiales bacterium]|nr:MBL fold metallo-hydrolase [Hyphomicrobiales bacterium]
MTVHLRVLRPAPNVFAFYDGRVDGYRFAEGENWIDDGALSLGIASYAIVDGADALVYDTHVTVQHAAFIRKTLADAGVKNFTVVFSHWHLDHVAGTEAFADCKIISNKRTLDHLSRRKAAIESGEHSGPPVINPLVLPTQTFEGRMQLQVGKLRVELLEANIHSDDATVLWLAPERLLLAGDTLEDTVTYVGEPENFDIHLAELDRLWALRPERILPNHGDPEIIALGGYERTFIRANQQYIRMLKRCVSEPELRTKPLRDIISAPLEAGWVNLFAPYEAIHRQNIEVVLAAKLS